MRAMYVLLTCMKYSVYGIPVSVSYTRVCINYLDKIAFLE